MVPLLGAQGGTEYGKTVSKTWAKVCAGTVFLSGYTWAIGTTALILFLPYEFAVESEMSARQMEAQQMAGQGGAAPSGGMDALGPTPAPKQ